MSETVSPRRRIVLTSAAAGAAAIAACTAIGIAATSGTTTTIAGTGSAATAAQQPIGFGWGRYGAPHGYPEIPKSSDSTGSSAAKATAAQQVGVVDIDTVLTYQNAQAAGTGMVLTSDGEILTNNHVVDGATSIKVTVVSSGATYTATVVGTDPTADVAVLQLANASGLQTARLSSTPVAVGAAVSAVGNAGGVGGIPSAATGTVTALGQSIRAADENGSNAEKLVGLIETDADVQAGDSGGPLYDATGRIVGMDTAASSGSTMAAQPDAYAIPIATAESIAAQIESGVDNATIHQGYPAFLGVSVTDTGDGGAGIAQVVSGGPAADAGLTAGDVITAIDGSPVSSASTLGTVLAQYSPGQRVSVSYLDGTGTGGTATTTVTLGSGPAD